MKVFLPCPRGGRAAEEQSNAGPTADNVAADGEEGSAGLRERQDVR